MTGPLKLLILGRDPDVFANDDGAPNDTRERHIRYVQELQRRRPGSDVRIVVHTRRPAGKRYEEVIPGMHLYGTFSRTRLHCPVDMARLMVRFRREGWIPDVISCQTGFEEGPLAILLADPRSKVQIQIHNDFYGDAFGLATLLQRVQRVVVRWAIRRCDQARVVSEGIGRQLIECGDLDASRIVLAPVPIVFEALPHRADPARPVVLYVGRLVAQKDMGLWCDAAALVHARVPEAEFWVVGDGPDRGIVEGRVAEFDGKMRLFGMLPYSELAEIYAQSTVFLLASAHEGLGRVIVEAMLADVPVVSVDIVGPEDLIEDRVTGRLVPRDAAALAEAVVEVLEQPELAREFAVSARQWAETNYEFDAVAAKLVDSWEAATALPKRSS